MFCLVYNNYHNSRYRPFTLAKAFFTFAGRLSLMSAQSIYPADTLQYRPYPHLQPNDSEDFKGSSDTLINVNGLPHAANSRHQTFSVSTPTNSRIQRGLSIPLSKFSSKQSDETHETSCAYPPVAPPPVDTPSLWQRVSAICLPSCLRFLRALLDCTRVHCLPFLCCDSPNRDRGGSCHRGRVILKGTTNHASQ